MANRNIEPSIGEILVPGAAPGSPVEGQMYYDATAHALQIRGAAAWTTPVTGNAAITAGTNTKITYDAKGLITAGVAATTADIADSADRRYCTDAQKTVIGNTSGTNTGDQSLTGYAQLAGATFTGEVVAPDVKFSPGSAPVTPAEGQVYYDSTDDMLKFRNASAWVNCGGGGAPEAWTDATYAAGWQSLSEPTYYALAYMKDPMGFVCIRGTVKYTSGGTNDIFTLPVGYRPARRCAITTIANATIAYIEVLDTGVVRLGTGSATSYLFLDGIRFDIR